MIDIRQETTFDTAAQFETLGILVYDLDLSRILLAVSLFNLGVPPSCSSKRVLSY